MIKRILLIVFAIISILHIYSEVAQLETLNFYTKPLLLPCLLLYYSIQVKPAQHSAFFWVIGALVFSWLGDVLLLFKGGNFFIFGLSAFLVSHVLYIISYRKSRIEDYSAALSRPQLARYDFFLLLIFLALTMVLRPHLGSMLLPVLVYAGVITYMGITAIHRYGKTSSKSYWLVVLGALIFMFSDSTLAINKFVEPIPQAGFTVMLSYIVAQYLIVEGLIAHTKA